MLYRKAAKKNLIRGRNVKTVVSAMVYAACRSTGIPRTLDELSDVLEVSRKEIGRTYRFIARELGLKLMPTSPQEYISRFCRELNLNSNVQSKAIAILNDAANKALISSRRPTGVAAASIYIASILCGERRTQREVADVVGVTEVTTRNTYKELVEKLGITIDL
jgi:transcription initiation factor TFIIB